jgi:Tol biopolymer transport system component
MRNAAARQRGPARRFRQRGASACAALLAGCTLLDQDFEPATVTQPAPGATSGGTADDARPSTVDVSAACTVETAGVDGTCAPVPLLPPAPLAPSTSGDAGLDALDGEPCAGGLGEFATPEMLTGLDLDGSLYGPALSRDGRTLFFSLEVDDSETLYQASRTEPASSAFSTPTIVDELRSSGRDGTPFLSSDGLSLYFDSEREGGQGGRDLWVARRTEPQARFGTPTALVELNTPDLELLPWLTSDALTLLFVSSRGQTGDDIWFARRGGPLDAFSVPVPVEALNDPADDGRAVLSADGRTAFLASRRGGNADLWTATRATPDAEFSAPENLVALNSPATDWDVTLSASGRELVFASDRSGTLRLWHALRGCR